MSDPRRIPEDEARELFRRAAELQAASERAAGALPAAPAEEPGMSLAEVTAAAEGAGIHPDFVRVALAERRLPDADDIRRDRLPARVLRRVVSGDADVIEAERLIPAPAARVLEAVRRVFPQSPFMLVAEASLGDDPLRDGVLVYRMASKHEGEFARTMNLADARVLLVTLRAEEGGTRVRVRVPLFRRGVNLAGATGFSAGGGWLGGFGGTVLAGAVGVAALPVIVPAAGLGALLGVGLYRQLYRGLFRGGRAAVDQLLQAVALEAEPYRLSSGAGAAIDSTASPG